MERILITFGFQGTDYTGYFTAVFGAGSDTWHLTVNNYHWGALQFTRLYGWAFHGNKGPELDAMAEEFGELMMLWYQ